MNSTKISLTLLSVTVLCVIVLVASDPVQRISRQTTDTQGAAVLFFVSHEGMLREFQYEPIIFNRVVLNQGSAFDITTGVFTAPVAGIYQFVFSAQGCRGDHDNTWYFKVNGLTKMSCLSQVSGVETARNDCFFMEKLNEGDQVWMHQRRGSCAWASTTSRTINFSGMLVASEGVSRLGQKYGSCPLSGLLPGPHRDVDSGSAGGGAAPWSVAIPLLLCCFLLL